jgi:ribosomal-protein-alanine N-acetyltransferase
MPGPGDAKIDGFVIRHEAASYRLRPPEPQDAEAYVAYLQRNWSRFRGAMPTADDTTFDVEAHRQRLARLAEASGPPDVVAMMMFEGDGPKRVVGDITFSNIVYGAFCACHLGFRIDAELEGLGIMRRALETCCDAMFERFGLHRIMANYRPENVRSVALLKRLGFEEEGFARAYLHLDGEWRDHILTALVRPSEP